MSHGHRFFRPDLITQSPVALTGDEARHAVKALRIREGDTATLMDGQGSIRPYSVRSVRRDGLLLEALSDCEIHPPPRVRPFMILGAPEIKALEESLLHAIELGLYGLMVVQAERSPFPVSFYEGKKERLLKIAASAIKQSGNPFLPAISFHEELSDALKSAPRAGFLLDQSGRQLLPDEAVEGDVGLAVGPEGDFTGSEKDELESAGYRKISLSANTLRVETAALAAVSLITSRGLFSGSGD